MALLKEKVQNDPILKKNISTLTFDDLLLEALGLAVQATSSDTLNFDISKTTDGLKAVCKKIVGFTKSKDFVTCSFRTKLIAITNPNNTSYWKSVLGLEKSRLDNSNLILKLVCCLLSISLLSAEEALNLLDLESDHKTLVIDHVLCFYLVEDALDLISVDDASVLLDFVESNISYLIKGIQSSSGNLTLLRLCNELTRRLSKTKHTIISGRLLLFVAGVFDLFERSGVNLKGEFNVSNETTFVPYTETKEPKLISHNNNRNQKGRNGNNNPNTKVNLSTPTIPNLVLQPLNFSKLFRTESQEAMHLLYNRFWTLHKYFNNPLKIISQSDVNDYPCGVDTPVTEFDLFVNLLDTVLSAFEVTNKLARSLHSSDSKPSNNDLAQSLSQMSSKGLSRRELVNKLLNEQSNDFNKFGDSSEQEESEISSTEEMFFPKYLTNKSLFELQLRDSSFRRQVIYQIQAIINFILQLTPKFQEDLSLLAARHNRTLSKAIQVLLNSFKLTTIQEKALRMILQRSEIILNNIIPDSRIFLRSGIITSLYEKNWELWKYYTCPSTHLELDADTKKELENISYMIGNNGFTKQKEDIEDEPPVKKSKTGKLPKDFYDEKLVNIGNKFMLPEAVINSSHLGSSDITQLWLQTEKIESDLQTLKDFKIRYSRWGVPL